MYLFWYRLRIVLTFIVVVGILGALIYVISVRNYEEDLARYNIKVTAAVATAVQEAVYNVTRTAEAPLNVFRLVQLGQAEKLADVAERYGTTLEIIQIVNSLPPETIEGNGETIVVPVGIQQLDPLRTISVYTAQLGDTLETIAQRKSVTLALLKGDNPALAARGVHAGDLVFIGFTF
ncbi:MAG: LysM peptidoglycan-binding domain-containing protein [Anaerolineae bacterium]|nr:LysM peptidoglycan-binding domain-containing protein [Anaerolineae bacterium]